MQRANAWVVHAEPLLLPLAIAVAVVGGAFRIMTIDRGTPQFGLTLHVLLLVALFVLFALPLGALFGAVAARLCRRSGAHPQPDASAFWVASVLGAFAGGGFVNLGRSPAAWHVTAAAVAWTALLSAKMFRLICRAATTCHSTQNGSEHAQR